MELEQDFTSRISPIEKLISNQRLTYLPNLYYQLYRAIQKLSLIRSHFPQQKVLIEREPTTHDNLLQQAKQRQFIISETVKYKKVIAYQLAKSAKQELFKRNLKKEQKYLFHRISSSYLAEAAIQRIHEQSKNKFDVIQKKPQQVIKKTAHHTNNDIFIDRDSQSGQEPPVYDDLLGDILNQNKPPIQSLPENTIPQIQNISSYIRHLDEIYGQKVSSQLKMINRKLCMKKINQNLRKRMKNKINDDSQERNLSSATVLITKLTEQQSQSKSQNQYFDIPSSIDYLKHVEGKNKRKKSENFQLKWDQQNLSKLSEMNPNFDLTKKKFGSNFLLLSMDKRQYQNYFDKNIQSKITFPPTIQSVPNIEKKFKKKYYYNSLIDPQFQKFVMKHNKKKVFEKFKDTSKYVLDHSYHHDIQGSESVNMAKMFLTNQGPLNDRVIYKINNNKSLSAIPLPAQSLLTRDQLSELTFIVRKYMGVFGSNWRLISLFVSIHPTFSNMFLSSAQIQQLCQVCKHKNSEQPIQNAQNFFEKNLPFSVYSPQITTSYSKLKKNTQFETLEEEKIENKSQQTQIQQTENININEYQNLIRQPLKSHEVQEQYTFKNYANQYQKFCNQIRFPTGIDYNQRSKQALIQGVSTVINDFQNKSQKVSLSDYEVRQTNKNSWIFENISSRLKGQIKAGHPVRKRKNINEKTSELVKILHTLKQKMANPSQQGQSKIPQASAPSSSLNKPNVSGTPANQSSQTKRILPKKPEDSSNKDTKQKQLKDKKQTQQKGGGQKGPSNKRKKKDKDEDK